MSAVPARTRQLLDFKGKPKYILPTLSDIQVGGTWEEMDRRIIATLKGLGSEANDENLVSAYVTPTLRNLKLIEGKGDKIKVTADGRQCLEAALKGDSFYKRRLALQALQRDEATAGLVPFLIYKHSSLPTRTTTPSLKRELAAIGVSGTESQTRLLGWIDLLSYVGLVQRLDEEFYVLPYQVDIVKRGEKHPSQPVFESEVRKACGELAVGQHGSKYVPIPGVRDLVCTRKKVSQKQFNDKLTLMYSRSIPGVVFATPRGKREGGIKIGKKYFYYIAVF